MFKAKPDKALNSLNKNLVGLNEDPVPEKCLTKLTADIQTLHKMLYGDSENPPKKADIDAIVPGLLDANNNLFEKLALHLDKYDFESKKKTAEIMNYIVRRTGKENNNFADYLKKHLAIVTNLLKGYHDQNLSQNVGSVLQEMCKRSELAKLLLNDIKIKIHNRNDWKLVVEANTNNNNNANNANNNSNNSKEKPDEATSNDTNNNNNNTNHSRNNTLNDDDDAPPMPNWNRQPTAPGVDAPDADAADAADAADEAKNDNNGNGGGNGGVEENKEDGSEYNDMVDELFVLVQNPSFDIASDAYKTLQLLLTRHKKEVSKYLESNYTRFFEKFNYLIMSENYVTKRQFLKLLSELLLDKHNFKTMLQYISEKGNLINSMRLIKNGSKAIAFEAFHIFKVFVANPNKSRDVHIILYKNQQNLIQFLSTFLKDKEDQSFISEKEIVIQHLNEMPVPEEIRKKQEELERLQQEQAANGADAAAQEEPAAE